MPDFDLDSALAGPAPFTWAVPVEEAMHWSLPRGLSLAEHLTDLSTEQEEFTPEMGATAWTAEVEVDGNYRLSGIRRPCFVITVSAGEPL